MEIELVHYSYLSAFLFSAGVFIVLSKKNVIFVLIGIEMMLNSANLLLAVFSSGERAANGQIMAIFAVVLTVCEVAIALAILLNVTKYYRTSDLDELEEVGNE